jgi:hypothetical protein
VYPLFALRIHQEAIAVPLHLFDGNRKSKVVQQQELQFQLVQFGRGQTADFGVSRVGIEYVYQSATAAPTFHEMVI